MKSLFLVAHADDEVLGCGATLGTLAKKGEVDVIVLADGASSREIGSTRDEAAKSVFDASGSSGKISFFNFPDNKLDSAPLLDIIQSIERSLKSPAAQIYDYIFTHFEHDLNVDHCVASKVARTLARPSPHCRLKGLFEFETPSATDWGFGGFRPDMYVDAEEGWQFKMFALEIYGEEMRNFPHPRSRQAIESLAAYRGSVVGLKRAEAFRTIWRRDIIL